MVRTFLRQNKVNSKVNKRYNMKYGQLKGYNETGCKILLYKPITNNYTIADFHAERCKYISYTLATYNRYETELKEV